MTTVGTTQDVGGRDRPRVVVGRPGRAARQARRGTAAGRRTAVPAARHAAAVRSVNSRANSSSAGAPSSPRTTRCAPTDCSRAGRGAARASRSCCLRRGRSACRRRSIPCTARLLDNGNDDVISLACAITGAHPAVGEAIAAVAADAPHTLLPHAGYLPLGLPELRARIADFHTRAGLPTAPEQVIVTTGAQQAVNLCAALYVQPGDRVVVESPSFAGTLDAFRAAGSRFVPVAIDDRGVDVRGVRDAIDHDAPALVYLMPSFPTTQPAQCSSAAVAPSSPSSPSPRVCRSSRTTRSST